MRLTHSDGQHLFTLLACMRALQAGSILADRMNDTAAATYYSGQAEEISTRLNDFWSSAGYWRAMLPNTDINEPFAGSRLAKPRTSLDCALPLAVIHGGQDPLTNQTDRFEAHSSRVLSTLREYVMHVGKLYAINNGKKWTEGWAVGRYEEDIYNGVGISQGNPW